MTQKIVLPYDEKAAALLNLEKWEQIEQNPFN